MGSEEYATALPRHCLQALAVNSRILLFLLHPTILYFLDESISAVTYTSALLLAFTPLLPTLHPVTFARR